jgi:hypothetical protein
MACPARGQLGSGVVLAGESAEDLFPADPVLGEVDRFGWTGACSSWRELAEGTASPTSRSKMGSVS